MKWISKYMLLLSVITFMMLLFVHQQISIVQCSYDINKYKIRFKELQEKNRNLRLRLIASTTPTTLQEKLTEADIALTFPSEISLIKVPVVQTAVLSMAKLDTEKHTSFNMLKMLGFEKEAQADIAE